MSTALERITSKRTWFVPGVVVSGVSGVETLDYLAVETVDGQATIFYGNADLGQGAQQFLFQQLTDDRGNQLPRNLDGPRVFVRPTGDDSAYVVGQESDSGFKLARSISAGSDVIVDLFIIEHGR